MSRYSETHSRYSENGAEAWSDPDSITEFEMAWYSEWILIKSLKYDFGAIYWVFLSTLKITTLINLSQRYLRKRFFSRANERSF